MRWRRNPRGTGYFVVGAMMLLVGLQGCTIVVGEPAPLPPCTPPPGEAQLLADYQSQTVLGVLPASVTETPRESSVIRYCDLVGTDHLEYSEDTAVLLYSTTTAGLSAAKLLTVYGPAATQSGWSLISKSDQTADCGLTIVEAGVPACMGTGILFCKVIDGVTTDFMVSSDTSFTYDMRVFARRDLSSCANGS